MPYTSIEQLPDAIKSALPSGAQSTFMAAFNSAYSGTCKEDDACASKVAWSAVSSSYHKDKTGKWVKTQKQICPGCHINKTESHDAIIQLLDRRVGKLKFPKEPFIPTVQSWDGIPMVFAKTHPDLDALDENPEAELSRIAGTIVGHLSDPRLDMMGHPKLMAKENFGDSAAIALFEQGKISKETLDRSKAAVSEAVRLLNAGKLSHSTAFLCPDDGDSLYGEVRPNHHLVFEETSIDMPVDLGAVVLNKTTTSATTPQSPLSPYILTTTDTSSTTPYMPTVREMNPPAGEPLTEDDNADRRASTEEQIRRKIMDEKEKAELLKSITDKDAAIAQLQKERDDLKIEMEKVQKQKEDDAWTQAKAEFIAPGLVKDPNDEAALRKLQKEDPMAFTRKVLSVKREPTTPQGAPHANKGTTEETNDQKADRILGNRPVIPGTLH